MSKERIEWMKGFQVASPGQEEKKVTRPDAKAVERRRAIEDHQARMQLKEWGLA